MRTFAAHYRQSFDAAGVHPDDLKQLSDLFRNSPSRERAILRQHYPFGMFRR